MACWVPWVVLVLLELLEDISVLISQWNWDIKEAYLSFYIFKLFSEQWTIILVVICMNMVPQCPIIPCSHDFKQKLGSCTYSYPSKNCVKHFWKAQGYHTYYKPEYCKRKFRWVRCILSMSHHPMFPWLQKEIRLLHLLLCFQKMCETLWKVIRLPYKL